MNWATVAPETRIYKGKNLYRWEVSPGLEHHCGTCETPLHNNRAKTSCIGKHVEPCYRFHQQLHFIGRSHECFGCNTSDEMHHGRHKSILILVRQIAVLDDLRRPASAVLELPSPSITRRGPEYTKPIEDSSDLAEDGAKMSRRHRKKAKKMGMVSVGKKRDVELFPKEDTDFISEAIHLSIHETKGGWEGAYIYVNKTTSSEASIPEAEDGDELNESMSSLSVKSPSAPDVMTPRQRRCAKKFTTPAKHSNFRGGSRKYNAKVTSDLFDCLDPEIFYRLGVEVVSPIQNSVARKELVAKLVALIKDDLSIIQKEDEETSLRQEGFFRWAGKAAYQSIMDTRVGLDLATGQKTNNPIMEKREAGEPEAFVDGDDADTENLMEAMNDSEMTAGFNDSDEPHDVEEKNDFSVKGSKTPNMAVAKSKISKSKAEDADNGWETPVGKKVARSQATDCKIIRSEGDKVFRIKGKSGPGILKIVNT